MTHVPRPTCALPPLAARRTRLALARLGLALALAACSEMTGPLPREGAPEELEFFIGGFAVDSRSWQVRGDTVVFHRQSWDSGGIIETVRVVPTAAAWQDFWSAAERAGVRWWSRRYVAEGVVDGTGWSLRLRAGSAFVDAEGSNAFPDRRGRKRELHMPAEFEQFLAALHALVAGS